MNGSSPEERVRKVSVVIPNYNGDTWLAGCFGGLARQEFKSFETILVDNGSTDGSPDRVSGLEPKARVIRLERNLGFAAAVNVGIAASRSEYVALLNTDTVARPSWLAALVRTLDASGSDVAAAAPKMLRMDRPDTIDDAGDALSWTGAARKMGHGRPAAEFVSRREIFAPSAGASLYRRAFLETIGGFDDRFFAYLEDIDLGLRGRLCGYRYLFEPAAEILHKGQGSGLPRPAYVKLITRNRLLLFAKNLPMSLLLRHLGELLYGQLYFLVVYRRPLASLAGYVGFVPLVAHALRERRRLRRLTRIGSREVQDLLLTETGEPRFREIVARKLAGLFR